MVSLKSVKYLVIHCSATPPQMDIDVSDIRRWHLDRGWSDVGYHYIITRTGSLQTGRGIDTRGAHVKGHNSHSLGICLVGGVDIEGEPDNNFTSDQFETLHGLLGWLKNGFPDAKILGHRDFEGVSKACPSMDVREWLTNHPKLQ